MYLYAPISIIGGILLIGALLLLPMGWGMTLFSSDPTPKVAVTAIELSDFSGDGYSLSDMTAEYGSCWDKDDVCIRLAYTLNCGKQQCKVDHYNIRDNAIQVKADKEACCVWPFGWFNRHETADNRELKRGESHTEMVVFKLDKPEPGGVTITVDGQTVYQD